jgi:hypothetical protein
MLLSTRAQNSSMVQIDRAPMNRCSLHYWNGSFGRGVYQIRLSGQLIIATPIPVMGWSRQQVSPVDLRPVNRLMGLHQRTRSPSHRVEEASLNPSPIAYTPSEVGSATTSPPSIRQKTVPIQVFTCLLLRQARLGQLLPLRFPRSRSFPRLLDRSSRPLRPRCQLHPLRRRARRLACLACWPAR